jgi:HEAT repeat protein
VQSAAASKDASLLGPICGLLPTTDPALAEALPTALGQLGDVRVEDELLRLMSRDSIRVKRSAAAALGNVGTARAVEPLLLITSFPETERNAIRRIQARLEDAEAGRLSVAAQEPPVGGLSVALEEGALSVASGGPPDVPNGNLQGVPAGRVSGREVIRPSCPRNFSQRKQATSVEVAYVFCAVHPARLEYRADDRRYGDKLKLLMQPSAWL